MHSFPLFNLHFSANLSSQTKIKTITKRVFIVTASTNLELGRTPKIGKRNKILIFKDNTFFSYAISKFKFELYNPQKPLLIQCPYHVIL